MLTGLDRKIAKQPIGISKKPHTVLETNLLRLKLCRSFTCAGRFDTRLIRSKKHLPFRLVAPEMTSFWRISEHAFQFVDWRKNSWLTGNFSIDRKFLDRQKNFSIYRKFLDRQKNSRWLKKFSIDKINSQSTKNFSTIKKIVWPMKKFSRSFQIFLDFHNISRQRELFLDRGKSFLNRQKYFWTIENISRKKELFLSQQNYSRPLLSSMAFHTVNLSPFARFNMNLTPRNRDSTFWKHNFKSPRNNSTKPFKFFVRVLSLLLAFFVA